MEKNPTCSLHQKPILMVCATCKGLLCFKCPALHTEKGCTSSIDLPTYAAKVLLPGYKAQMEDYVKRKHSLQASAKEFESSSEKLKNDLIKLKEKLESMLERVNDNIELLKAGIVNSQYGKINNKIEEEYKLIKQAIENEDMGYIVEKINSKEASVILGVGDGEQQLLETIKKSIARIMSFKEFEVLEEALKVLDTIYSKAETQSNKCVYGICYKIAEYKKLCKFDIKNRRLISTDVTTYGCTITQIGSRIFFTGGDDPVLNVVKEFIEDTQSVVTKEPMKYAKCGHKAEPISSAEFVTIGGSDGNSSIAYCEKYSVAKNKWELLPSLNRARRFPATSFIKNKLLYAIGGIDSNNEIEMLEINEWQNWVTIKLASDKLEFDDGPAAFPISPNEIMILCGNDTTTTAIFNLTYNTVRKCTPSAKRDSYYENQVCIFDNAAYIIGEDNGHIHIYKLASKAFDDIDYEDAIQH
eukprot:TRINITY_DN5188_c0_g2_i4.p1 TRINITY_DN5188_c0_g2~~TRINITY_DN5188_c0_g2_i4.p1  ORF type:complete len:495 (-),score=79.64 TRINITY_DN5188_c0_g2_i4:88-1497(-)